jgi:ABC-2 type transport system permease protein
VPFGFATYYPGARLLARGDFRHIGFVVPLVSLASAALAILSWEFGVRHYSSTGS